MYKVQDSGGFFLITTLPTKESYSHMENTYMTSSLHLEGKFMPIKLD
jgi:hypothetical protein